MANFKTHLNIASVAAALSATSLFFTGTINVSVAIWLTFLGTIGGLTPDIDSDHSISIKVVFTIIAFFCAISVGWLLYNTVSLTMLAINVAAIFLAIRFAIKSLFMSYSVHRGCCHSITFAALIGMSMVVILHNLNIDDNLCWLSGIFLTGGCLIHLLLDEMYSIDIHGKRIKSSFGTALKLMSFKNPYISTLQITFIALLYYIAPSIHFSSIYGNWLTKLI